MLNDREYAHGADYEASEPPTSRPSDNDIWLARSQFWLQSQPIRKHESVVNAPQAP